MTAEWVAKLVSNLLTVVLAVELIPGIKDWWDGVGKKWKPLILLGLCLLIPFGVMGLECTGVDASADVQCTDPASTTMWFGLLAVAGGAFVLSQIAFLTVAKPLGDRIDGKAAGPKIEVVAPVNIYSEKTTVDEAANIKHAAPKGVAPKAAALSVNDLALEALSDEELAALDRRLKAVIKGRKPVG